jgi:hypothetical protein
VAEESGFSNEKTFLRSFKALEVVIAQVDLLAEGLISSSLSSLLTVPL